MHYLIAIKCSFWHINFDICSFARKQQVSKAYLSHAVQKTISMLTTKSQPALKIPAYRKEEAGECKIRLCRPPFSSLLQFGLAAIIGMVQSRDIISFNCIVGKMVASTDNITMKGLQGIIAFDTGFYQPYN